MTPDQLQAFMVKHDLTEAAVARLLGVPHQTVNRWKLGNRKPRLGAILDERIAQLDRQLAAQKRRRPPAQHPPEAPNDA